LNGKTVSAPARSPRLAAPNYNPDTGVGSSSFHYWEEDTSVTETMRRYKGTELSVIERIRLDGQRHIYKHEVTGPGDKRDEREIVFELAP
jgi:hypothetical protein